MQTSDFSLLAQVPDGERGERERKQGICGPSLSQLPLQCSGVFLGWGPGVVGVGWRRKAGRKGGRGGS